ncbi:MAG TPA: SRPBCC family protein [Nitriliruptoraceae bacterium]|nr:SRPBCC family protein [Nitriliruptoraceae bacterium]
MAATTHETIDVDADVPTAFDYVANFGNLDEWDPAFDRAERTDTGPLGVDSTFDVRTSIGPSHVQINYRITEFDRPRRVKLVGTAESFTSIDVIEFRARPDGGTTVAYDAEVDSSLPDWADSMASPLFALMGKLSAAGMRDQLGDDQG